MTLPRAGDGQVAGVQLIAFAVHADRQFPRGELADFETLDFILLILFLQRFNKFYDEICPINRASPGRVFQALLRPHPVRCAANREDDAAARVA